MLQLNLLPDVKKEFLHAQRQRNLVMSISILVSLVAGGVILLLGLIMGAQLVQKNILNGNIKRDTATLQQYQEEKQLNEYLTVQNQLSQLGSLKDAQPIYSRLFDYLRQLNPASPNNVELDSAVLLGSEDGVSSGTIELQGSTANFESLNVYETTLVRTTITYSQGKDGDSVTELLFDSVVVKDIGLSRSDNDNRVTFTINLTYNLAAFMLNSIDTTLKVPQETTSDADRNAPRNVFNQQPATDPDAETGGGNE